MPARVKVRAVIWVDGKLAVHRSERRGEEHVTLPGGRVNERESVITALEREVLEELGVEIEVGDLLFAAEVVTGPHHQDIELVFDARLRDPAGAGLEMVDPLGPDASSVLPPVIEELARRRQSPTASEPHWLGNLYAPSAGPDGPDEDDSPDEEAADE